MPTREWMDEEQAARWLDVPVEDVQEAIAQGRLPALVIGRHVRISQEALLALARRPAGVSVPIAAANGTGVNSGEGRIPLPAGASWTTELTPAQTFEHQWPDGKRVTFDAVWQGALTLQNKPVDVRVGHIPPGGEPEWLVIFLGSNPLCEFAKTLDGLGYASLIKPDGGHVLPWNDPLPALYEGVRVQPYREATGFAGRGVPKGTAVVIAKDDLRSAVHQAIARWLGKNNLPLVPAA